MMNFNKLRRHFLKNQDGSTAMMVAVALPMLIGFGVLAIDVGHYYSVRTEVQQAADISALSILTKMRDEDELDFLEVSAATTRYRKDAVAFAQKNLPDAAKNGAVKEHDILFGKWDFKRKLFNPLGDKFPTNAVQVYANLNERRNNPVKALFGKLFKDHVEMRVSSVAVMPIPPAFHMLSPDASGALEMNGSADIDVYGVQVNSSAGDAFIFNARVGGIGAPKVNVVGGATGPFRAHKVETGVGSVRDFLEDLPAPAFSGCDEPNNFVTSGLNPPDLAPGVYCGGLTITGADEVTFSPGIYIIKGGPLTIDGSMGGTSVKGDGVLIYLADEKAELRLQGADLALRAMRTGTWAGVALMAARGAKAPPNLVFSGSSVYVSGIVHVPGSKVEFTGGWFNGVCRYLCVVSDTLKLNSTFVNYAKSTTSSANPFGDATVLPAEPQSLKQKFRPYLVNKAPISFF